MKIEPNTCYVTKDGNLITTIEEVKINAQGMPGQWLVRLLKTDEEIKIVETSIMGFADKKDVMRLAIARGINNNHGIFEWMNARGCKIAAGTIANYKNALGVSTRAHQ